MLRTPRIDYPQVKRRLVTADSQRLSSHLCASYSHTTCLKGHTMATCFAFVISHHTTPTQAEKLCNGIALAGGQSTLVNSEDDTVYLPHGGWYFSGTASNDEVMDMIQNLANDAGCSPCSILVVNFSTCLLKRLNPCASLIGKLRT